MTQLGLGALDKARRIGSPDVLDKSDKTNMEEKISQQPWAILGHFRSFWTHLSHFDNLLLFWAIFAHRTMALFFVKYILGSEAGHSRPPGCVL